MARPRILVTNDDGITSPGLHAVAGALRALGDVWVVAPDRERTAVGHAVTLHKPLRITKLAPRVFAVNGTPVDCVNLALVKVLPASPALIVSGINRGVNLGDDVMYSGTVSAALEGAILGVPSMAVSQEGDETFRFEVGALYAARVAQEVLTEGLPPETILNVNIPNRSLGMIKGVKITCLSRRRFENPIVEKVDPRGRTYYWIAGTRQSWGRRENADHEALARRMVSVTPIHLDTTHYGVLDRFKRWESALSRPPVRRRATTRKVRKRGRA
ncbi:5'/3'-nucleotidase SurE [Nitrospirales bacterium NOB]|nr:MAG: 5'-nucleotidase SurE [Nitrospira sp. OLB3]MBV6468509.1 5'-nucleotidase SurE [Nitrospirota bacterium]MCE7965260.1 5'/3'-nucleotidase SurE [Nitrospira sp. NTP2]MCK6491812.1 5'/3'-nucleotidase SurE [Nitrospira sp.]MDL1890798.1 5'/3'-nucleotidase SurE [Nitrospirales bacterium NOB]MEB2339503.1 5'/3'-nucleotidase SurE [Nitrospirales bacterium]